MTRIRAGITAIILVISTALVAGEKPAADLPHFAICEAPAATFSDAAHELRAAFLDLDLHLRALVQQAGGLDGAEAWPAAERERVARRLHLQSHALIAKLGQLLPRTSAALDLPLLQEQLTAGYMRTPDLNEPEQVIRTAVAIELLARTSAGVPGPQYAGFVRDLATLEAEAHTAAAQVPDGDQVWPTLRAALLALSSSYRTILYPSLNQLIKAPDLPLRLQDRRDQICESVRRRLGPRPATARS